MLTIVAVVLLREPAEHQGRGGQRPFAAFGDVLRNPHARLLLIVFAIETIGTATLGTLLPYVLEYVVGRPDLIPQLIAVYMVPAVVFVPLWIVLARRIGKKTLWLGSMCAMTVAFVALFFVGHGDWLYVAVLALVAGVGGGCGAVVGPSIQADVIDWDDCRPGAQGRRLLRALELRAEGRLRDHRRGGPAWPWLDRLRAQRRAAAGTLLALRALFGLFPERASCSAPCSSCASASPRTSTSRSKPRWRRAGAEPPRPPDERRSRSPLKSVAKACRYAAGGGRSPFARGETPC